MYKILCDGKTLHDVRDPDYQVLTPKISLELNKTGNLDFGMLQTHPHVNDINKLKSRIDVYEDDELLFSGRSLTDEKDFQNTGQISCEGELSFLLDSIQRPHNYGSETTEAGIADTNIEIFKRLIQEHNSQVEEAKRFEIGVIDIESVTIKSLSTNYEKTWDFINSNFLEKYDGYLRVRHDGNVRYLDYVKQYGNVSNQVIRFGENLLDLKKYSKAEDIKTAIIPVGAVVENKNVTITTANGHNGTDYVYNQDAVNLYGWIYDKVDFPEVYDPDKLLEEVNKYLQKCINLAITIELTAVDLHMIDVDINAIRLGDLVPCISTQHGIMSTFGDVSTYYLVSKYELDLENPANNKITLGRTISSLTDTVAGTNNVKGMIQTLSVASSEAIAKAAAAEKNAENAAKTAGSAAGAVEEVQKSINGRTVGNNYGNVPYISNEGTMQVGKTIEFHSSDNYPESDGKLYVENGVLYFCDKTGTVKTIQMI
ncbi:MAG: phage tail spike protein [Anaerostipes hadrus]|nr:phage tail spike protein [Anaerostipes hadrus]